MSKVLILVLAIMPCLYAEEGRHCSNVGGALMTNINAIPLPDATNGTNLGPMFGDLAGSVAATILGQDSTGAYLVQHYFVTTAGDTIKLGVAHLKPSGVTGTQDVVAVRWGDYISKIVGGTGKYENATGQLEYFGLADFANLTFVLRYRGQVCYGR